MASTQPAAARRTLPTTATREGHARQRRAAPLFCRAVCRLQACFQLCGGRPSSLALALAGSTQSTLAPDLGVYLCPPEQLPHSLLQGVMAEAHRLLKVRLGGRAGFRQGTGT